MQASWRRFLNRVWWKVENTIRKQISKNIFPSRLQSIWLTAYASKILGESLSEVSQRFGFSVDLRVVESAVEWIITQQLDGGSFQELEMFPDSSQAPVEFQEISVTSQVVIMIASLRNFNLVCN